MRWSVLDPARHGRTHRDPIFMSIYELISTALPFVLTQQIQYCTAPPLVLTDRICLVQGEALEIRSSLQAMPMKM
jgi:hypothetical protein